MGVTGLGAQARLVGPRSGHVVGDYHLGALVGAGGVGQVYRARHLHSGAVVALKIVNRPATSAATSIRFMREVDALRRAACPHVVSMYGWDVTEDGHHYLAMELLEGESLRGILRRERRMQPDVVATMVEEVAAGLEAAHEHGIVHRDIKPSNIFCAARSNADPCWTILDFGLSKFSGPTTSGATTNITNRNVVGTPGFLSPEQALGEQLDPRSDVFALATLAYTALTGCAPFFATTTHGAVRRVVHEQPIAPSEHVAVDSDVDRAFMLGLSKHVGDRLPTVSAFASAFRESLSGSLHRMLRLRAASVARSYPWTPMQASPRFDESWMSISTLPTM